VPSSVAEAFTDFIPHAKQFDKSLDEGHGSSEGVDAAKIQIGLHSKMQGGNNTGTIISERTQSVIVMDGKAMTKERAADPKFVAHKDKTNTKRLMEPGHLRKGGEKMLNQFNYMVRGHAHRRAANTDTYTNRYNYTHMSMCPCPCSGTTTAGCGSDCREGQEKGR
jgi:hypothetical protein